MKAHRRPRSALVAGIAFVLVAGPGAALAAEPGGALTPTATGTVSSYLQLSYAQSALYERLEDPAVKAACESVALLSAESPSLLLRLRVAALAQGDAPSTIDAADGANALVAELREAETAYQPSSALALRGGMLLRSLGVGGYGSPVDPFARDRDQGGFWGLDAEWTPGSSLSASAILSGDRAARRGSFAGVRDFDAGGLVRFSPGALDAAAGAYVSGAGRSELRPIAYCSLPVAGFLASLEAALSLPLDRSGGADYGEGGASGSIRAELRRSLAVGESTLELGAAYRGIFPGRSEAELAALAEEAAVAGAPTLPFAPFYGRHYAEFSLYLEKTNAFSLTTAGSISLPWGSLSTDSTLTLYAGDLGLFLRAQWIDGESGGEFVALARAEGLPLLVLWTGVTVTF